MFTLAQLIENKEFIGGQVNVYGHRLTFMGREVKIYGAHFYPIFVNLSTP